MPGGSSEQQLGPANEAACVAQPLYLFFIQFLCISPFSLDKVPNQMSERQTDTK